METNVKNADRIIKVSLFLVLLIIPIVVLFLWKNAYTLDAQIDSTKFGTFGDFVGGVLGSIWSLCGVLLFYTALKEQRRDFQTNNEALLKQIEALEIQSEEFKLQRNELAQSRQVFVEQSKTLMQQRLESTYFSLLNLYNNIVSELNSRSNEGNYFKELKGELFNITLKHSIPFETHEIAKERYLELFYERKEELSHYFKLLYRILKIIDDSEIPETEKFRYIKILRSQLSENEMLAIYYNSHSLYGAESYKLILKYNLLKHLSHTSKIEFKEFTSTNTCVGVINLIGGSNQTLVQNTSSSRLHRFSNEILRIVQGFILNLSNEIKKEGFDVLSESYSLSLTHNLIIELSTSEYNELTIAISTIDSSDLSDIVGLKIDIFERYFCLFLYDTFIFSRYIDIPEDDKLVSTTNEGDKIVFNIKSNKKLQVNSDLE